MTSAAYDQHQKCVQDNLRQDPKSFWNYIKSKKGSRNRTKIVKNGEVLSDKQCAEELAAYFHSVYSRVRAELNVSKAVEEAGEQNSAARVHLEDVQLKDVVQALRQLKPKKSAGPDGIPPYIFKDCRSVLAAPLHYIYNKCLSQAVFPEKWKITRVVPVPKGSLGTNVDGYRPIAILSTPAKVLESIIHKSIYPQVSAQLVDAQHGFRPARSTTSNLLSFMADITSAVDSGGQADAAYFDYKKAFDLVDNDVLLKKFASVGFTPHLLKFFVSYMRDRQQFVEYAGYRSKPYFTWSGVSQGSNLGPLAFVLMINDLPRVVQDTKCLLFADDLKLSLVVNDANDCEKLQKDIDRVVQWTKDNALQFNTAKCVTISFTRSHCPIHHKYHVDGTAMARVTEVKDLGVPLTSTLTFRDHVTNVCKKAFRTLGFTLRTTQNFANIHAIVALYNTLVRSQLECNSVIWSPHETKYVSMLEKLQNKFVRFLYLRMYGVYPFYPLNYPTLFVLGMVGYNELGVRRQFALVAYVFKIMRGHVHNPDLLQRIHLNVPDRYVWRRLRPQLLNVPRARTNLLKQAPLTRAIATINLIAERTDLFACTLNEFTKTALYVICYVQ